MEQYCILVAKSEPIIASDLCDTIAEAGFRVFGPHKDLASAMLCFNKHKPDLAILDLELNDGAAYPLAELLIEENVPVIFQSRGKTHDGVKAAFPEAGAVAAPCPPDQMLATLSEALQA